MGLNKLITYIFCESLKIRSIGLLSKPFCFQMLYHLKKPENFADSGKIITFALLLKQAIHAFSGCSAVG